jgi:flavin reductase (NADH)
MPVKCEVAAMTSEALRRPTAAPVDLRPFMASFPSGVAVVTTAAGGEPWGMTCTSLSSVCLAPPVVLVCLRLGSPTLKAIRASGSFAVNLLHGSSRETAALFASGSPDRFDRVAWTPSPDGGPHLVSDAFAVADCGLLEDHVVGDHAVVFGEVRRITDLADRPPLLYGRHSYAVWQQPA